MNGDIVRIPIRTWNKHKSIEYNLSNGIVRIPIRTWNRYMKIKKKKEETQLLEYL